MDKKVFKQSVDKGWVAMEEHYFTTAWVPDVGSYQFITETFADHSYSVCFVGSQVVVSPGKSAIVGASLYAGPEIMQTLQKVAPGLELTVDYGSLWWICQPIFHLMCWLYSIFGNWGVAIILVTVLIKLAFYKLSASSYRSMGNMKKLQPKMEQLKEKYGDDRQKFGQAVMELYKKEKVNPLGGCLPILIQIPVFIALYYVLLESVELRQAPFALWLQDLSVKDPFYVLPIIMGCSMFLQQRMSPAPPDPVQAKVMMAMPIVFTVMFLQFPSGLVLYWVVNNGLSILQQWFITRRMNGVVAKK
jgi:YidC/Oxa1 family membrane protein insertase